MICPKCNKSHEGENIPPSLVCKIKTCFNCYKAKKKETEKEWYKENKHRLNKKRQEKRKANPLATLNGWRERTRKWKMKLKLAKLK